MKTVNVIGCGNVGKTLGRLWTQQGVWQIQCVLNRSLQSAAEAVEFVGSGRPVHRYADMGHADIFMISASDQSIEACCRQLSAAGLLRPGVVVFHCSGALPSTVLQPATGRGAWIASMHPVKSFADPATAVQTFAGTFCALEGDRQACELIDQALRRCGAIPFYVQPQSKTIYHAATVIVCNYLVALMEVGLRCFEKAGVSRETAVQVIEPIVSGTVGNVLKLGPVRALTGPIARGEVPVVQSQCEALGQWDENVRQIYECLGRVALELSAAQGNADRDALAAIAKTLQRGDPRET